MTTTAIPRVDSSVTLGDGRRMAYSEWGHPDGKPLFLFHGTPASRLFCPDEGATTAAGVRLITLDRPGYGGSDPRPGRAIPGFVDDFAQVSDALEIDSTTPDIWPTPSPTPVLWCSPVRSQNRRPPLARNPPGAGIEPNESLPGLAERMQMHG